MTGFMDWEDFKPWTLSLAGSVLSALFVARGLLRPVRNRVRPSDCDQAVPLDCEQGRPGYGATTFSDRKLLARFVSLVGLLLEDEETVSGMSAQWVDAVNAKGLKLDVEKVRGALANDRGALAREGLQLIRHLARGGESGTVQDDPMPFPFCARGTSLARMEALVETVEKGDDGWRHEGGYEARWLGLAQIHILAAAFHFDPEYTIDWLALLDALLGGAMLMWNVWSESHIWTLAISVRGMVTLLPYWKRCKRAQTLLRNMPMKADTAWGTAHAILVGVSEVVILSIMGSFVLLNAALCLATIWPYVWFPYALYTIAPILSGDEAPFPKFWRNKPAAPSAVGPDGRGASAAGNFVNHVEIRDAAAPDVGFMVAENGVLVPMRPHPAAKIAAMISPDRRIVAFKLVQAVMLSVVVVQAVEIAAVAGVNVYHGERYWDALGKACAPWPTDDRHWDGGDAPKTILELL